jgi:DNA repair protein RadC
MDNIFHYNNNTEHYMALRPLTGQDIINKAKSILAENIFRSSACLTNPKDAENYLILELGELEHEVFSCLFLDNRHRAISYVPMFRGTIDGASVYPREVVKEALKCNAAAVIFAHNHPSGVAEPSIADQNITKQLKSALGLVDVRVLDHFVISPNEVTSFAKRGLI